MKQRIVAIDILRGFALLGILLMNIMSFAMPESAYFNPTVYYGDGINRVIYGVVHVIADQKFMALFSMLFGASVMLLTTKLEAKGQKPAKTHYIRNGWLLVIGLVHALLIWSGDVLIVYALASFVLYFLRRLAPKWQFALGVLVFFLPSLLNLGIQTLVPTFDDASRAAIQASWAPSQASIEEELMIFRGTYAQQVDYRMNLYESSAPSTLGGDLLDLSFLVEFFARALGMMLIGMAFYTWGILTAQRSDQFYRRMVQFGFGVGLPTAILGLLLYARVDWAWEYAVFIGRIPNHIATPFIACGYIGLVMLWSRRPILLPLRDRFASVGQTALTNYIGQSLIATFIFYGFGLGLFGSVNRIGQLAIMVLIWAIQLAIAPWWLARFRYGPLEWGWRTLTYLSPQPLLRRQIETF